MEKISLNKSPILTNEQYKINDIKYQIPKININEEFENKTHSLENIEVNNNKIDKLTYGLNSKLDEEIIKCSNDNLSFTTTNDATLKFVYNFDNNSKNLNNTLNIEVNHNLNMTIIYKSLTDDIHNHNSLLKIKVNNNAKVNITIFNLLNESSLNTEAIEILLKDDTNVNLNILDLGAKTNISNLYINAEGKNSIGKVNTIYMGKNNEEKDINYITHLNGEKSIINMDLQGVLDDESKKTFKGTLDFKQGCTQAIGSENEHCILLKDTAISRAMPILLCAEEDVEGEHSTSSGKVEEEPMFYMMSRGISEKEALKLLVKANFDKVISSIKDDQLKEEVIKIIERRLK